MFARDLSGTGRTVGSAGSSWQLILADLALILFMVAALALSDEGEDADEPAPPRPVEEVPAQALYRPRPDGPAFAQWLAQQDPDRRMSVSVVATHRAQGARAAWEQADRLARAARGAGIGARIILREGDTPDLYASLGYDAVE